MEWRRLIEICSMLILVKLWKIAANFWPPILWIFVKECNLFNSNNFSKTVKNWGQLLASSTWDAGAVTLTSSLIFRMDVPAWRCTLKIYRYWIWLINSQPIFAQTCLKEKLRKVNNIVVSDQPIRDMLKVGSGRDSFCWKKESFSQLWVKISKI